MLFAISGQDVSKTDFVQVIGDNMKATQSLVTKLVGISGGSASSIGQEDVFRQCQQARSEVRGLESCHKTKPLINGSALLFDHKWISCGLHSKTLKLRGISTMPLSLQLRIASTDYEVGRS